MNLHTLMIVIVHLIMKKMIQMKTFPSKFTHFIQLQTMKMTIKRTIQMTIQSLTVSCEISHAFVWNSIVFEF